MNKSGLSPIESAVNKAVDMHFKNREDLCFVLGVSGGIDSTSLLHVFARLQIKVVAVHINYNTRGDASKKDVEFVKQMCDRLQVKNRIFEIDSEKASYSNFQAWARTIRYNYFEEVARKVNGTGIAVAHNEDDQIETVLQKIFRGSGLAGWAAMQIWDGRLFRPLLNVSREEIERHCKENNIAYRVDSSNLENKYARNFLRNEWLPQFTQHFPGWRDNIQQVPRQATVFKSALKYILDDIGDGEKGLHKKPFLSLPMPLQKSLLLLLINKKWPDESLSKAALDELTKIHKLQTGKKIQLSERLFLVRDREFFRLLPVNHHPEKTFVINYKELEDGAITFENIAFSLQPFEEPNFKTALYLDAKKLRWPLRLRPWAEGDRLQPFGMDGHQTVADHLTNRKVSAVKKTEAMVVADFEETIAAVIFPLTKKAEPGTISELFKCTASTQTVLMIKPDA